MNEERRVTLRYLIDMYSGIFDDDVIEAVLEHRDWNSKMLWRFVSLRLRDMISIVVDNA